MRTWHRKGERRAEIHFVYFTSTGQEHRRDGPRYDSISSGKVLAALNSRTAVGSVSVITANTA